MPDRNGGDCRAVWPCVTDRTESVSRRTLAALVVLALLAAACGGVVEEAEFTAPADGPLLVGEFETLAGGTVDLDSLQGQDVVLWFWAPW